MLAEQENIAGLAGINREVTGKAEAVDSPQRVVLDMDSTEIPTTAGDGRWIRSGRYRVSTRDIPADAAESRLTRRLFGSLVRRIDALAVAIR